MLRNAHLLVFSALAAFLLSACKSKPSGETVAAPCDTLQYRQIEFLLGNKNAAMLKPHEHRADLLAQVQDAYEAPSLYDVALKLLARRGLDVPADHLQRDWTQPYQASEGVEAAWLAVYRQPDRYWDLYQLGEKLTDLEDAFRLWRFRHVTTVERVIGFKRGTGGTSGVAYLRRMLEVVGYRVVDLQRIRFGALELGDLPEGEWRRLTAPEIARLHGKKKRD